MSDFRRRIMMGISTPSGYPDPWVDDGKIWAYYNVTNTEAATSLLYRTNSVATMEVDGVSITPATSYQFSTVGEHLVKYTTSSNNGTNIPDQMFMSVTTLIRLYMPDTITTMSSTGNGRQFYSCSNLTFVRFSANLESVAYQGFTSCSNLVVKRLVLPKLTSLDSNCFRYVKIENIVNLGDITSIPGGYIFANNSTLKQVTIPSTVTSIGDRTFNSSGSSCVLTCLAVTPPTLGSNAFSSFSCSKVLVPASSVEAYKTAWSGLANKIEAIPTT